MSTEQASLAFCEEPTRWERIKTLAIIPPFESWGLNNSDLSSYSERAGYIFSEDGRTPELVSVITKQLEGQEDCVGLDLAGGKNGVALQELLLRGIIQKGLFTNFNDLRRSSTRSNPDLAHIDGNLLNPGTWSHITEWAETEAPQGFAIVMHQPGEALQGLSAPFYRGAVHQLIDMTRPGGMILTKIPIKLRRDRAGLKEVCESIRDRDDIEGGELTPSKGSAVLTLTTS